MDNTILIADDDKEVLGMLERVFIQAGFTVHTAETCKDAIRLACCHLPDCFLFDYHLAGSTAAPACLFIRSHELLKNAPIVILSGDPGQAAYSYDACQADVFLGKGGSSSEILVAVKHHLRRAGQAKELVKPSDLDLDVRDMRILKHGVPMVTLSPKHFTKKPILIKFAKWVREERS